QFSELPDGVRLGEPGPHVVAQAFEGGAEAVVDCGADAGVDQHRVVRIAGTAHPTGCCDQPEVADGGLQCRRDRGYETFGVCACRRADASDVFDRYFTDHVVAVVDVFGVFAVECGSPEQHLRPALTPRIP